MMTWPEVWRQRLQRHRLDVAAPAEQMLDVVADAWSRDRASSWQLGDRRSVPAFGGNWPRWQLALGQAAAHASIAFGPNRGNRVTYVRLDQWVGKLAPTDA